MAYSVILIAVLAYLLSLPDICALVSVYGFQDDLRQYGPADYPHLSRRFGGVGVGCALLADLIRALIAVLVGGILLKKAGYAEIGKLLALFFTVFFMLAGQAFPAISALKPRRNLVYPALLLIFADWRIFLICAVPGLILYLLTGLRGVTVFLAAIILPVFSILFRHWWLFNYLMLLSGLSLLFAYGRDLWNGLFLLPERIEEIPRRLRAMGERLRLMLEEDDEDE